MTKKAILVKVDTGQLARLNELAKSTRVPRSVYLREAVDDLTKKYKRERKHG